jgi:hypothetical protein
MANLLTKVEPEKRKNYDFGQCGRNYAADDGFSGRRERDKGQS